MTEYEIVFDGGSKGNPGLGYGSFVISYAGDVVIQQQVDYGDGVTNNEAEYRTLIEALNRLIAALGEETGTSKVTVFGDSQLVVNQVNGRWKIKNPDLFVLRNRAVELLNRFGKSDVKWHSRTNSVAILGH